MREKTHAHRNYTDDVPAEVKQNRLERMIETFHRNQLIATQKEVGKYINSTFITLKLSSCSR
jgi:tRNA A37 methylthiotransferase MiaB